MNVIVVILAAYGLTFAIRAGKASWVTDHLIKISFFQRMFACVFCTATECGFWLYGLVNFELRWSLIPEMLVVGLASGVIGLGLDSAVEELT